MKGENRYFNSAFLLLLTSVIVKIIGAVYKIPLTAFIGAVGRGYFAAAYNVYLPVHAVLMGGFPIALSRLVSKYNALGNKTMLSSLKRGSLNVFFITGILGMAVILLAAKPYAVLIASSPKSVYTIYVLAPSLLFSCLAACYRGYFEGFLNMRPTAVSQTVEALFKMIFGLLFAKLSMGVMLRSFFSTGTVIGVPLAGEAQALSFIYPFTSAAAMLGVTLGAAVSYIYVFIYYQIHRDKTLPYASPREGRTALLHFSFPIIISSAVQSVFQFLDTATVQYSLGKLPTALLKETFPYAASVADADLVTYVFGLFSAALDFKNLIPGVTMALGVCAVPALCREFESKRQERLEELMNSVFKYTVLLASFGGCLMALCSKEMLTLFYASSPDIADGCTTLVRWFGFTVPFYSLASTAVFCVQALGKPERSVSAYIVAGIIRVVLNVALIRYTSLTLFGAVISGAVGYCMLFIHNAAVAYRIGKVKFDVKNNVVKPLFVSVAAVFATQKLFLCLPLSNTLVFHLLTKAAIFGTIYCILCVFVKLLNFKQIFCGLKMKKMA